MRLSDDRLDLISDADSSGDDRIAPADLVASIMGAEGFHLGHVQNTRPEGGATNMATKLHTVPDCFSPPYMID